ncbi:MAG: MFS transporter [bacterium]|nr:MFS transporter [bacterium]
MHSGIILLAVVSFLTDLSSEIILPLLPLHLAALGAAGTAVGLVGGLGDAAGDLLKVFAGYTADRLGRKKPLVIAGYTLSSFAKLLFPLAVSWQQFLLFRPLERIGKGLRSAPRDAIITDLAGPELRGRAFGFHRAMDTAGAIAGTCAGLLLIWGLGLPIRTALMVGAALAFAALPLLFLVQEERRAPVRRSLAWQVSSLPGPARRLLLVSAVFALGRVSYMFYLLRASGHFIGQMAAVGPLLLYLGFNVVYTLTSMPAGHWSDRKGRRPVLVAGLATFAISCVGMGLSSSVLTLALSLGLLGLAHGMVEGNFRAYLGDLSPAASRGTTMGLFHTLSGLAALAGGVAAGLLWDRLGPPAAFTWGAVLSMAAAGLLARSPVDRLPAPG